VDIEPTLARPVAPPAANGRAGFEGAVSSLVKQRLRIGVFRASLVVFVGILEDVRGWRGVRRG
jgi:hypothetical protein